MRHERVNFGLFLRIGISLLPIIFGMPSFAMVFCAYNISVSFLLCGPLTCVISALASVCISMFFFGSFGEGAKIQGLFLSLEAILCAAACIYSVVTRKKFFYGVWMAALGFLVPSFMSLRYEATAAGVSVAQYLTDVPIALMKEQMQMLFLQNSAEIDFTLFEQIFSKMHTIIIAVIPSVLVISSVIIGYVVMWLVCLHHRKMPFGITTSFAHIKIPKTMVAVLLISLVLLIANIGEAVSHISMNLCLILTGLCFFAGMSILDYYIRGLIKNGVFRLIIHALILLSSSTIAMISPFVNVFTVYAFAAVIDAFVNFRKIERDDNYVKGELDETEERQV